MANLTVFVKGIYFSACTVSEKIANVKVHYTCIISNGQEGGSILARRRSSDLIKQDLYAKAKKKSMVYIFYYLEPPIKLKHTTQGWNGTGVIFPGVGW